MPCPCQRIIQKYSSKCHRSPSNALDHNLTSKTFNYLSSRGSKIRELSFAYGDMVLGERILPNMFSNLTLYKIDLSWCGISSIEDGAFDSYPDIRFLYIASKSLGPRKYKLFKKTESGHLLKGLSVSFTTMLSDNQNQYDISPILT